MAADESDIAFKSATQETQHLINSEGFTCNVCGNTCTKRGDFVIHIYMQYLRKITNKIR